MGRVKKWLFATFFSCITKVKKGKYSGKGSGYFRSSPRIIPENITPVEDAWLPNPSSSTPVYMDIDDYGKHPMNSMEEEEEQIGDESSPLNEGDSENRQQAIKEQVLDCEEEFSFWPWNDSKHIIDICIADEIFSHGRLLPMQISSESAGNTRPVHRDKPHRRKVQIQFSDTSHRLRHRNRHHKMSFWKFLRIGIMTMPEFQVHTSSFAPRSFF